MEHEKYLFCYRHQYRHRHDYLSTTDVIVSFLLLIDGFSFEFCTHFVCYLSRFRTQNDRTIWACYKRHIHSSLIEPCECVVYLYRFERSEQIEMKPLIVVETSKLKTITSDVPLWPTTIELTKCFRCRNTSFEPQQFEMPVYWSMWGDRNHNNGNSLSRTKVDINHE